MSKTVKLTPKQAELLEAMRKGAICHFMTGLDSYYFRNDTHRRCTAQVRSLLSHGLVEMYNYEKYSGRHQVRARAPADGGN